MNNLTRRDVLKSAGAALLTFPLLSIGKPEAKAQVQMAERKIMSANAFGFNPFTDTKYLKKITDIIANRDIELKYYYYENMEEYSHSWHGMVDVRDSKDSRIFFTPSTIHSYKTDDNKWKHDVILNPTKDGENLGFTKCTMPLDYPSNINWKHSYDNILAVEYDGYLNIFSIMHPGITTAYELS